jgi:hypothetical protein
MLATVFLVEVEEGRIVRKGAEEDVVCFSHGSTDRVLERLTYRQFVEK